ncbi:MAG: gamma-glutamylcyclotransferase, partial [Proteobacteria bacterium]|nr:gamma-glutamylcyclotransferase [Pseudomonadota bacterium]
HADFYDYGTMRGRLFDLGSYPCVVPSGDPSHKVRGELFLLRAPCRALSVLDDFEGVPGGRQDWAAQYLRKSVAINSRRHGRLRAWVYLYRFATDNLPAIVSGDYVRYRRGRINGSTAEA